MSKPLGAPVYAKCPICGSVTRNSGCTNENCPNN